MMIDDDDGDGENMEKANRLRRGAIVKVSNGIATLDVPFSLFHSKADHLSPLCLVLAICIELPWYEFYYHPSHILTVFYMTCTLCTCPYLKSNLSPKFQAFKGNSLTLFPPPPGPVVPRA